MDILADIQSSITAIITDLRAEREQHGPTAHYLDGIAQLAKLIADRNGLIEALAPSSVERRNDR